MACTNSLEIRFNEKNISVLICNSRLWFSMSHQKLNEMDRLTKIDVLLFPLLMVIIIEQEVKSKTKRIVLNNCMYFVSIKRLVQGSPIIGIGVPSILEIHQNSCFIFLYIFLMTMNESIYLSAWKQSRCSHEIILLL